MVLCITQLQYFLRVRIALPLRLSKATFALRLISVLVYPYVNSETKLSHPPSNALRYYGPFLRQLRARIIEANRLMPLCSSTGAISPMV